MVNPIDLLGESLFAHDFFMFSVVSFGMKGLGHCLVLYRRLVSAKMEIHTSSSLSLSHYLRMIWWTSHSYFLNLLLILDVASRLLYC